MRLRALVAALLTCFLLLLSQPVLAAEDAESPNLTGIVVDSEGASIGRAHIWIHTDSGKDEFVATADTFGRFSIHLPDGLYNVMIASPGFAPFSKRVWIHEGKSLQLKTKLKVDMENMQD